MMKNKLKILLLLIIIVSCKQENNFDKKINLVKNSNLELFDHVNIESRHFSDDIYQAPYLLKFIEGKEYSLPNFKYYGCSYGDYKCLDKSSNMKFNITKYGEYHNVNDNEIEEFVANYCEEIFLEFEKLQVYKIVSKPNIGDCIIFYFDEKNYLAYVKDTSKIFNEFWKNEFKNDNSLEKNWYSNINK